MHDSGDKLSTDSCPSFFRCSFLPHNQVPFNSSKKVKLSKTLFNFLSSWRKSIK